MRKNIFLALFLSGFLIGVAYIAVFGREAVQSTSLMSRYFFSKYEYMEPIQEEIFLYVLKRRLSAFTVLWLTGLTILGTAAACCYLFWLGAALGITLTTAAMKMGLQGIGLCLASGLPHFVLYVPAVYWCLNQVCEMSGSREVKLRQWNSKRKFYAYVLVWIIGILLFLTGSFLETYVNPFFLKTFLKML
jgi:uncharacterized membrane protein SpoIIM required for sporulation